MPDREHYYHAHDLPRFGDMGKAAPALWESSATVPCGHRPQ